MFPYAKIDRIIPVYYHIFTNYYQIYFLGNVIFMVAPAMGYFQDGQFPLCTFDVILLTDTLTVCRWSWRVLLRRFALSRCTANVS